MINNRVFYGIIFVFFASLVGFIVVLATPDPNPNSQNTQKYEYGCLIDAGSSGSRMHVYRWKRRVSHDSAPKVEELGSLKITPGISSFVNDAAGLNNSLKTLIDFVLDNNFVPVKYQSDTPLYLKATAGMRLLPIQEQDSILNDIRSYFSSTPFSFQNDFASVIPGEYEGAFGWITVNHLKDTLGTDATLGALDLGGASTQITFSKSPSFPNENNQNSFNITISKKSYSLYVHSYLGWGGNEAFQTHQTNLPITPTGPGGSNERQDPCWPIGLNGTIQSVPIVGTSNYSQCLSTTNSSVLFNHSVCEHPPCPFNNVYQPPLEGNFVGFSLFYYTGSFFNLTKPKPSDYGNAASPYCDFSWNTIQGLYGNSSFLKTYCFNGVYIDTLLTSYGFETSSSTVTLEDSINGVTVGWALGAMIYEANILPILQFGAKVIIEPYPNGYYASHTGGQVLLGIFGFLFILSSLSLAISIRSRFKEDNHDHYLNLDEN